MTQWLSILRGLAIFFALGFIQVDGAEPLHLEIDRLLAADANGATAAPATDAEFLRRVSLDLVGLPPRPLELQSFLADTAPDKRAAEIDRLLASPLYARNLALMFDVMLMERRPATNVPADDWQAYLLKSFQDNKPYNVLAREILSADGTDPALRAAARFYLDRNGEPNLITRDVGRIFFGRDFQCNQCHDHPIIADYHQTDYHGLLAFFGSSSNLAIKEGEQQKTYYVELAASDAIFESVFIKGVKHITRPKLPGDPELIEPMFYPGEEYDVRPAENVRPVPKYSRRLHLAESATSGANRAFNENIANRLWEHMLGRGLVSPPDLHHSANPPTHPALMRRLGERLAEMNFDLRAFLREIALTQAYQRSIDEPRDLAAAAEQAAALVAPLAQSHDDQLAVVKSLRVAADQALSDWAQSEAALLPVLAERDTALAAAQGVAKKFDDATKAGRDAQAQLDAKAAVAKTVGEAAAKTQEAVKLLPNDQELSAAAAKFAERTAALDGEVETLKKGVEEKAAAVAAVQSELAATHPAIDASQAKVVLLEEACRDKYTALVTARNMLAEKESAFATLNQRIELVDELVGTRALREQLAAARRQADDQRAASEVAIARQTEITPRLTETDTAHQQAVRAAAAAEQALAAVKTEHVRQQAAIDAVNAAAAGTAAALEKLPSDAALTDAGQTLQTRAAELGAALAEHQAVVDAADEAHQAAAARQAAARSEFEQMIVERGRRQEAARAAVEQAEQAAGHVAGIQADLDEAAADIEQKWAADGSIAALQALSPEQMCASIFRVTGVYDNYRASAVTELDNESPLSAEDRQDPARLLARERDIEQRVYDKLLKPNFPSFVSLFGAGAGQPQGAFFASADQALYTANGGSVLGWAGQNGDNITTQVVNEADPHKVAELLYRTVLTRSPTDVEVADVTSYLASRMDQRQAAAQELVWGLIASVEFRFNH